MDYDEMYQPLIDFIAEKNASVLFLQGEADESNQVMFYLPRKVEGDKDTQTLYVEFS